MRSKSQQDRVAAHRARREAQYGPDRNAAEFPFCESYAGSDCQPGEHACVCVLAAERDDLQRSILFRCDELTAEVIENVRLSSELESWREACVLAKRQRDRAIARVHKIQDGSWHPDQEGPYS